MNTLYRLETKKNPSNTKVHKFTIQQFIVMSKSLSYALNMSVWSHMFNLRFSAMSTVGNKLHVQFRNFHSSFM